MPTFEPKKRCCSKKEKLAKDNVNFSTPKEQDKLTPKKEKAHTAQAPNPTTANRNSRGYVCPNGVASQLKFVVTMSPTDLVIGPMSFPDAILYLESWINDPNTPDENYEVTPYLVCGALEMEIDNFTFGCDDEGVLVCNENTPYYNQITQRCCDNGQVYDAITQSCVDLPDDCPPQMWNPFEGKCCDEGQYFYWDTRTCQDLPDDCPLWAINALTGECCDNGQAYSPFLG
ncbi:MAG TPA: hypothetical protein PKH93_13660, partial [Chitinophagales bacterium]|nr:hypothetical protein [Chitinophagales bacterium]